MAQLIVLKLSASFYRGRNQRNLVSGLVAVLAVTEGDQMVYKAIGLMAFKQKQKQ